MEITSQFLKIKLKILKINAWVQCFSEISWIKEALQVVNYFLEKPVHMYSRKTQILKG